MIPGDITTLHIQPPEADLGNEEDSVNEQTNGNAEISGERGDGTDVAAEASADDGAVGPLSASEPFQQSTEKSRRRSKIPIPISAASTRSSPTVVQKMSLAQAYRMAASNPSTSRSFSSIIAENATENLVNSPPNLRPRPAKRDAESGLFKERLRPRKK